VTSLRRTLYVDPSFGLAAFRLARAHEQALRTLDQVDLGDVAAACSLRLTTLSGGPS